MLLWSIVKFMVVSSIFIIMIVLNHPELDWKLNTTVNQDVFEVMYWYYGVHKLKILNSLKNFIDTQFCGVR